MTTTRTTDLTSSLNEAVRFIRNNLSGDLAAYGFNFDVVNIDRLHDRKGGTTLILDLSDGTTIRLDIERHETV